MTGSDSQELGAFADAMTAALKRLDELERAVGAGTLAPREVANQLARTRREFESALALALDERRNAIAGMAATVLFERLTPRECEVLDAVVSHGTTARAAESLAMSETTFNHHRSNILRKLGVTSFPQATHLLGALGTGEARPAA